MLLFPVEVRQSSHDSAILLFYTPEDRSWVVAAARRLNSDGFLVTILDYQDYRLLLKKRATETDWESLPPHFQDTVDTLSIEESESEQGEDRPLWGSFLDTE